jgi:photosystem II stability/assembly factor-like uncharacterized protein
VKKSYILSGLLAACFAAGEAAYAQTPALDNPVKHQPAAKAGNPLRDMMLSATHAGKRLVAVGERGVVLLSDDDGATYRQAKTVPTRATLTSVHFVDDKTGWAAGHWGCILMTADGGETWQLQRDDLSTDQPLFSVWFRDHRNGIAAGLFSLLLVTDDGGKTWNKASLPALAGGRARDVNLFSIFSDRQRTVWIAGEQGLVFRSQDGGKSWSALATGAKGTLWKGTALDDDSILVGGLSGNLYRSTDRGATWSRIDVGTKSSITDMVQLANGHVFAVGLDGLMLTSEDRGASFKAKQRPDQSTLTAVTVNGRGVPVIFSQSGVVKSE